ncbi:TRAP transporter small permease [Rhodobium gokarnense]|uniref:TRAP transporter small permease protein n=1 Tax=Rhodobium gokarnense TaxID=364296 RepID=A0ABT3HGT6_9HYPH|nr:TRAP transporter small permease [Rhodobium gokarnense]MCW2309602.1 TRAP-type C4-dicarboxylate transport system permease small subunit [Rhodobium gokarnense]
MSRSDMPEAGRAPDVRPLGPGTMATSAPMTPVHKALAAICGVLLIALMLVTVIDVAGRYLLDSPLQGATEITGLLLAAVIFIGLPAVCLDDQHVTIDLAVEHMPAWVHPARLVLVNLASAAVLAVVAWRLAVYGQAIAGYHEVTVSLRLPVAPLTFLCAACTAVAALITLKNAFTARSG